MANHITVDNKLTTADQSSTTNQSNMTNRSTTADQSAMASQLTMAQLFHKSSKSSDNILEPKDVDDLVASGSLVFIFEGRVIKADCWAPWHPGGYLVLQHMAGRDATDEVTALHSYNAIKKIRSYQIGRVEGHWNNLAPVSNIATQSNKHGEETVTNMASAINSMDLEPLSATSSIDLEPLSKTTSIDLESLSTAADVRSRTPTSNPSIPQGKQGKQDFLNEKTQQQLEFDLEKYPSLDQDTQQNIIKQYRALHEKLIVEGFFQTSYWNYAWELLRYGILFGIFLRLLSLGYFALSGIFLGLFWHQLVFSAHDAGHIGITHDYQTDTVIGIIIADFIGGLSMGWWKRSHNVHHILTNSTEHDPDIQLLPFFAVSHRFFESVFSTYHNRIISFDSFSKRLIPYQHYLYYPVLALGRFNLYIQSWLFLLTVEVPQKGPARWHRTLEIVGQMFFWFWFGYLVVYRSIPTMLDRVVFILLSHMATAPLHVQITMSHYGMSTSDLGLAESFPQRMLRTTMDVDCPHWMDFIHGGLQFQAIHHLFPRIPRHNLRRAQKLVQAFCEDVDIPYALCGFVDGNKQVIGHLNEVARHAKILSHRHDIASKSCTSMS